LLTRCHARNIVEQKSVLRLTTIMFPVSLLACRSVWFIARTKLKKPRRKTLN